MRKKVLVFLLIIFFSLGIFGGEICLAVLNAPTDTGVIAVGEGSARVGWQWAADGGSITRFVLSYRIAGTEEDWTKKYPSADVRDYTIMGLTENTTYEWTIMAEAGNPADNSSETGGPNFTTLAGAVNGGDGDGGPPAELTPPLAAETLEELFTAIINFLFYLAMSIGPIMIIWAAFLILTSAGKAEQVNKGKTIILWTLVAIAIVLLAKGLPSIIKGILGG